MKVRTRTTAADVLAALEEMGRPPEGARTAATGLKEMKKCPELRRASESLAAAVEMGLLQRQHSAFRAATYTPMPAPSSLLAPPV